jgi:hypothetical protein
MLNKIKIIIQAWITAANHTPEEKKLADSRMAVCNTCEFRVKYFINAFSVCGKCGCPLSKKVFTDPRLPAEDKCPEQKWEK